MRKFRINEAAKKYGIAPSRIRHYEAEGLIKCKRDPENNYRYFDDEDMLRLASILLYRNLGLSTRDIASIFENEQSIEKHLYKQSKLISEEIQSLIRIREKVYNIIKTEKIQVTEELFDAISVMGERENHMKKVNYDLMSKVYDKVRKEDHEVIEAIVKTAAIKEDSMILDVGCGTGNYTTVMKMMTHADVYGIDPSEGMLSEAEQKSSEIVYKKGLADDIPYADETFNVVYMTDVIHHVPDIGEMFHEIYRVLQKKGKVCISTQSHRQIEKRYMSEFFPGTAIADKLRYPTIFDIIQSGENAGLKYLKTEVVLEDRDVVLDEAFLRLLENKGYSMLHQLSDEEYEAGLKVYKSHMNDGSFVRKSAGGSLVWFIK